jgi:hypothetical protein
MLFLWLTILPMGWQVLFSAQAKKNADSYPVNFNVE